MVEHAPVIDASQDVLVKKVVLVLGEAVQYFPLCCPMQAYKIKSNNIIKQHYVLSIVTKFRIDDNYTILGSHRAFYLLGVTRQYCLSDTIFACLVKVWSNFLGINLHKSCNPSEAFVRYQGFLNPKYDKITVLEASVKENHGLEKKKS
jgi:hypothetical protein